MLIDLSQPVTQLQFAELIGTSKQAVNDAVQDGRLTMGQSAAAWLLAYCGRLREEAAGRATGGALNLAAERAALARAQRRKVDLQNAITAGEYAPIGLLADVLAAASAAVVSHLDGLMPHLGRVCPELSEEQRRHIEETIAQARNEWVRNTSALAAQIVDGLTEEEDEGDADPDSPDDDEGVAVDPADPGNPNEETP